MSSMTPQEIVQELDKHIVGQIRAKRAVAIALRNRWRRQQVAEPLRQEITPKNILMIRPTGVGKTEIARRLARLADAPFIKVEATKFTEVGYVGRDIDTIVRDLVEISIKDTREAATKKVRRRAEDSAEERVLDVLLPSPRRTGAFAADGAELPASTGEEESATRQKLRKRLREGELDDKEVDIEVSAPQAHMEIFAPPGMEELTQQIQGMFQNLGGGRRKLRRMKIREAMRMLTDEEAARLVNEEDLRAKALANVEENGIVFLDEIDKIASRRLVGGHPHRFANLHAAQFSPAAAEILKHALDLLGELLHPGRGEYLHVRLRRGHFDIDLLVVELALSQSLAEFLPRRGLFLAGGARRKLGTVRPEGARAAGRRQQDVEHPLFGRILGPAPHLLCRRFA